MRTAEMLCSFALVACAAAPTEGGSAVPVCVHEQADGELVLGCRCVVVDSEAQPGCYRIGDPTDALAHGVPLAFDPADERLVVVVFAGEPGIERVDVTTEEGVDVITLVGDLCVAGRWRTSPAVAPCGRVAVALRLRRRTRQLAIVLRDDEDLVECTQRVFAPESR